MQSEIYLQPLKLIEQNPAWIQRQLAKALGVSLGKTNYCLKALKEKGWVKWGNFSDNPNKLLYMQILTPQGITQKLRLTAHFLKLKEAEHDHLQAEIHALRLELGAHLPIVVPSLMEIWREPTQLED